MEVALSAVADYANIAQGNKLNVMGVFDTIGSRAFPMRHPFMVFAMRFRMQWEDGGKEHTLVVTLEDEDGRKSFRVEGTLVAPQVDPGMFAHSNHIIAIRDVTFAAPGKYLFRIHINGKDVMNHPLMAVQRG